MTDSQRLIRAAKAIRWLVRKGPELAERLQVEENADRYYQQRVDELEKELQASKKKLDEMVQDFGKAQSIVRELGIGEFPTASHTAMSLVHQIKVLQGRLTAIARGDRHAEVMSPRLVG